MAKYRKLGKASAQRNALLRNQVTQLLYHGKIDPDLVPIHISDEWLQQVRDAQPEFRDEKKIRYKEEYAIPDYDIDIITASKKLADLFEDAIALGAPAKKVSNWIMGETMRLMKENGVDAEDLKFSAENLAKLIKLVDDRVINGGVAKEVFEKIFADNIDRSHRPYPCRVSGYPCEDVRNSYSCTGFRY